MVNLNELLNQKPLVKICGNLYLKEAFKVAKFQPHFMGWIFSPFSPRKISIEEAEKNIQAIKKEYPKIFQVGVFSGNSIKEILSIIETLNDSLQLLDFIQVSEESGFIQNLREQILKKNLKIPVIPVIRPKAIITNEIFEKTSPSLFWILDRYDPILKGGTGKLIEEEFFREKINKPFLIAGGIRPENVNKMLKISYAMGIDVSSGIETAPGVKSEEKLKELFDQIHNFVYS